MYDMQHNIFMMRNIMIVHDMNYIWYDIAMQL